MGALCCFVIHHVHKSISQPHQVLETHWNVDEVVTSREAIRIHRLRQDVPCARPWKVSEDYGCEAWLGHCITTEATACPRLVIVIVAGTCGRSAQRVAFVPLWRLPFSGIPA